MIPTFDLRALLLGCATLAIPTPDLCAQATHRALLIGIDAYAHVPRLRGCVHDTQLLADLLRSRFGFTDIRLLHDAAATRAGLLAALRRIVADTRENDVLHVHYSGHGSQVEDLSRDESDGFDETLVPQDGRDPAGKVADVLDDELEAIFAAVRTPHFSVMLDACHSGGGTRAVDIQTRGLEPDSRAALYRALQATRHRDVVDSDLSYPLITSARAEQKALDGPVDGVYHGLFTAAFARALARADAGTALLDLHRAAGADYAEITARLRVTQIASTPVLEGRRARLARPLFDPIEPAADAAIGLRAYTPEPTTTRTVRLLGDDASARARFVDDLRRLLPDVQIAVDAERPAQLVIELSEHRHRVLAGDATTELAVLHSTRDATPLANVVARSFVRSDLLAIDNFATALDLRVWLDGEQGVETSDGVGTRDIDVVATGARAGDFAVWREGEAFDERNCFRVHVATDRPCYLTVVNVDERGRMRQLFPNSHSERAGFLPDGHVAAAMQLAIPDEISNSNRAGFVLPYRTPGHELVRVFATVELAAAQRIRDALARIERRSAEFEVGSFEALDVQAEELAMLRADLGGITELREVGIMGVEVVANRRRRPPPDPAAHRVHDASASGHATTDDTLTDGSIDGAAWGDWTAASVSLEVRS